MQHRIRHFKSILTIFCSLILTGFISRVAWTEADNRPNRSFTNSIGMKFVYVEAGRFMMGSGFSPEDVAERYGGEAKWYNDELPRHEVTLTKPFLIQITEVTQRQWIDIMGVNPSGFEYCGENCPIEKVSWNDAQEFIRKLNEREQTDKYRLPTEAEWEYACRAGSTTAFSFGNDQKDLEGQAWYTRNSWNWTHQVNHKTPNSWGIYDMHGNVWEWCQDWYGDYPSGPVSDPKGPSSGSRRVSRGGSWRNAARFCRSSYRYGVDPAYRRPTGGFRLVRDP